jgi:glutamine amidotransferase-like protein
MIIIFSYLIYQLISLFFKRDYSYLCCGIGAVSLKPGLSDAELRLASAKLKLLGLFNMDRGTDSTGLYINGELVKGYKDIIAKTDTSKFSSLIIQKDFVFPTIDYDKGSVAILHTRKATYGSHTAENAHPFLVPSITGNEEDDTFCCHNGGITNIWKLCNLAGINHSGTQLDSRGLYMLLDKVGLDILDEYEGNAALIWSRRGDPDSIFVYHGSYKHSKEDKEVWEERPMYYMDTNEGLYFASQEEYLFAIRDNDEQEVKVMPYNVVKEVKFGKFTKFSHKVVRPYVKKSYATSYYNADYDYDAAYEKFEKRNQNRTTMSLPPVPKTSIDPTTSLVWRETKPLRALLDDESIYFWKGRYWFNGELLSGIKYLKSKGIMTDVTDISGVAHYFFQGVMIATEKIYNSLIEDEVTLSKLKNPSISFSHTISPYSIYPVTNLEDESIRLTTSGRYLWWKSGKRVGTEGFTPKYNDGRHYHIVDGFLKEIKAMLPGDSITLNPPQLILPDGSPLGSNIQQLPWDNKEEIIDGNISYYDTIFKNANQAASTITDIQIEAIQKFLKEAATKDGGLPLTSQEAVYMMWEQINYAVKNNTTIRIALEDNANLLEYFEKGEEIIPDADVIEELEDKQEKMTEVLSKYDDVLDIIDELHTQASQLQNINESPLAKDGADVIFKAYDTMIHNLAEVSDASDCKDLTRKINNKAVIA